MDFFQLSAYKDLLGIKCTVFFINLQYELTKVFAFILTTYLQNFLIYW